MSALSPLLVGAVMIGLALLAGVWLLAVPSRALPAARRRWHTQQSPSALTRSADRTTAVVRRVLERVGRASDWAGALDRAGIRLGPAEFVILVGAGALAGLAIGMLLGSMIVGLLLGVLVLIGAIGFVSIRSGQRRADFADQLDDLLQLLASNMRAGHSLMQSFDALTTELDEPSATEIARVVNQTRVGRDLGDALQETGERMDSDDFRWVAQAVAIHRQVGGNLADVLDSVSHTIRERNKIRRQVRALAAEGKLSGIVLMGLPIVMTFVLIVLNPSYISLLVQSPLGYMMIAAGVILLTLGGLWLRKIVEMKF